MEIIALMHCLIMVFAIFEQAVHFYYKDHQEKFKKCW